LQNPWSHSHEGAQFRLVVTTTKFPQELVKISKSTATLNKSCLNRSLIFVECAVGHDAQRDWQELPVGIITATAVAVFVLVLVLRR
jgi:hypothetical protein